MTPTREEVIRVALECGFYGAEVATHEQRLERLARHFYEAGAAAAREPHPPSRLCMCDDCKPSFEEEPQVQVMQKATGEKT